MKQHGWLAKQLPVLLARWPEATHWRLPDGRMVFCVPSVKLDAGKYNADTATVWFETPASFPWSPPENFYIPRGLSLAHGGDPGLTANEPPAWCPPGTALVKCFNRALAWDRCSDTISTYVRMCQRWFVRRVDGHEYRDVIDRGEPTVGDLRRAREAHAIITEALQRGEKT